MRSVIHFAFGIFLGMILFGCAASGVRVDKLLNYSDINTFEECAALGLPVTGESPRQCRIPNGYIFEENTSVSPDLQK